MDHWRIPYLEALKPKKIRAMITRSPERPTNKGTTAKKPRARHQVESPFPLPLPHSHQEDNEARTTPAIFLACALQSGDLMKIKDDDPRDPRGAILCSCTDPTKRNPNRTATFQEFKKGQNIIIPPGTHLIDSRAVFMNAENKDTITMIGDKEVFLLNIQKSGMSPDTKEDSPETRQFRAYRALMQITEKLNLEQQIKNQEMDHGPANNAFIASAPDYAELAKPRPDERSPYITGKKVIAKHSGKPTGLEISDRALEVLRRLHARPGIGEEGNPENKGSGGKDIKGNKENKESLFKPFSTITEETGNPNRTKRLEQSGRKEETQQAGAEDRIWQEGVRIASDASLSNIAWETWDNPEFIREGPEPTE